MMEKESTPEPGSEFIKLREWEEDGVIKYCWEIHVPKGEGTRAIIMYTGDAGKELFLKAFRDEALK